MQRVLDSVLCICLYVCASVGLFAWKVCSVFSIQNKAATVRLSVSMDLPLSQLVLYTSTGKGCNENRSNRIAMQRKKKTGATRADRIEQKQRTAGKQQPSLGPSPDLQRGSVRNHNNACKGSPCKQPKSSIPRHKQTIAPLCRTQPLGPHPFGKRNCLHDFHFCAHKQKGPVHGCVAPITHCRRDGRLTRMCCNLLSVCNTSRRSEGRLESTIQYVRSWGRRLFLGRHPPGVVVPFGVVSFSCACA